MAEAYRLIFEYSDGQLVGRDIHRLNMIVPDGDGMQLGDDSQIGRFVELRASEGDVLYRRQIDAIIPRRIEYPTGDPKQPFGHVEAPPIGVISILVPVLAKARSAALIDVRAPMRLLDEKEQSSSEQRQRDLVVVALPDEEGSSDEQG